MIDITQPSFFGFTFTLWLAVFFLSIAGTIVFLILTITGIKNRKEREQKMIESTVKFVSSSGSEKIADFNSMNNEKTESIFNASDSPSDDVETAGLFAEDTVKVPSSDEGDGSVEEHTYDTFSAETEGLFANKANKIFPTEKLCQETEALFAETPGTSSNEKTESLFEN